MKNTDQRSWALSKSISNLLHSAYHAESFGDINRMLPQFMHAKEE